MRRMPPEILADIFSWTLPSMDVRPRGFPDMELSPWILTQVSTRWRDISVFTPSLWCDISVAYGVYGGEGSKFPHPPMEMVRTQVERAGTQNLRIQFYASESHVPADQVALFQFLASHSARWEQLDIRLVAPLVPHLTELCGRLPALHRLSPSLVNVAIEYPPIQILFPAQQLTAYRVQGPWETHYRVLKTAPNIVEARIILFNYDDSDTVWSDPNHGLAEMVHLRRLYVSDIKILDYLRAPVLAEIVLDLCVEPDADPLEHLDPFLARSLCAPWRLCLTCAPSAEITATILNTHPFIISFGLVHTTHYGEDENSDLFFATVNEHITMLTESVDNSDCPLVAPHLSEICFGSCAWMSIDYPLFLKMLESRRRAVDCALSAAAFLTEWGPLPDTATLAGMDELRKGGLNLEVQCGAEAAYTVDHWNVHVCGVGYKS
ncbi:hypothetical protein FB45DRAFT_1089824 [Roridomyces roridus]|uniref:F-box domain-containing protein n=1 Tax=Roridomyces roridus TaxID=1738132 RepID=A0AAD7BKP5_9AGAR|nr:hypothetical protein FB45DRAFT_1089824 [Roridomyces roridus]